MSLSQYRLWKGYKVDGKGWTEKLYTFPDMKCLIAYLVLDSESPVVNDVFEWGIEKFDSTQNIWVDAFFSDDMKALFEELLTLAKQRILVLAE